MIWEEDDPEYCIEADHPFSSDCCRLFKASRFARGLAAGDILRHPEYAAKYHVKYRYDQWGIRCCPKAPDGDCECWICGTYIALRRHKCGGIDRKLDDYFECEKCRWRTPIIKPLEAQPHKEVEQSSKEK